jgi:redox-sensitive bicupin YhaK (pirin superfamily)
MTAGKGVQHCEMFPMLNQDEGNPTDFFQIWLNLPAKSKMVEPHFSMLWNNTIPVVREEQYSLRIIAGSFQGHQAPDPAPNSWAVDLENDVQIWTLNLDANGSFEIPATKTNVTRSLYFFEGEDITIDGKNYSTNKALELDGKQATVIQNGSASARFLILQGKPIDEPVAQYGPFVMNSREEIMQAMDEFRQTEFGGWPWPTMDHVHDKEKGKFALYPDGTEVTP